MFVNNTLKSYLKVIATIIAHRFMFAKLNLICLELYNLSSVCYRRERWELRHKMIERIKVSIHCLFIELICKLAKPDSIECVQASEPRARLFRRLSGKKQTSYRYITSVKNDCNGSTIECVLPTRTSFWLITGRVNDKNILRQFVTLAKSYQCDFLVLGGSDITQTEKSMFGVLLPDVKKPSVSIQLKHQISDFRAHQKFLSTVKVESKSSQIIILD